MLANHFVFLCSHLFLIFVKLLKGMGRIGGNDVLKGSRRLSKLQARIRAVEVGNVTISESFKSNSNLLASY